MRLIVTEDKAIGFLNARFSILGEGEKSCQVISRASFIGHATQLMCLVGLALQGIGFMNIIPHQFFYRIPDRWIGVSLHVHRNRYNFTLGDPFKKTGTSLADPLLPLLDILVARFPTLSEMVYASTRLWVR